MKNINKYTLFCATLLFTILIAFSGSAFATVINVNTAAETTTDPTKCTLKDAFYAAAKNQAVKGCPAGSAEDEIILLQSQTYILSTTSTPQEYYNALEPLENGVTTLRCNNTYILINSASVPQLRFIEVKEDATLNIDSCIFLGGKAQMGGAIFSQGTLNISNSRFGNNTAFKSGGAILQDSIGQNIFSVINSDFTNNSANENGGAISIITFNPYDIRNSFFEENYAGIGGGAIYIRSINSAKGNGVIENSTFYLNSANAEASAIVFDGYSSTHNLQSSSVFRNKSNAGAIQVKLSEAEHKPRVSINNSILFGNEYFAAMTKKDCDGDFESVANSLISNTTNCFQKGLSIPAYAGLSPFSTGAPIGYGLGKSHFKLLDNISAINLGGTCSETDQLDFTRIDLCDAGSVEARCGDAIAHTLSLGEECDDGNFNSSDACTIKCKNAICGDGFTRAGFEACDDGNKNDGDACTNKCALAKCGDGIVQVGVEQCDDFNKIDNDACTNSCKLPANGDGIVNMPNEECDDGNQIDTDACTNTFKVATCGDSIVRLGLEQCDDGNKVNEDGCRNDCILPSCGDGIKQAGEACDDGNIIDTDACTHLCQAAACGDGFVEAENEECDNGTQVNTDACTVNCMLPFCGDGIKQSSEECDNGKMADDETCSKACKLPINGDGIVNLPNEECEDGNKIDTDACTNLLQNARCGDGIIWEDHEECDDGNEVAGDGCDAKCAIEELIKGGADTLGTATTTTGGPTNEQKAPEVSDFDSFKITGGGCTLVPQR